MSTKLSTITGGLGIILGGLIVFTPFQLAPVCQELLELKTGEMVYMHCVHTGQAVILQGIAIVIISLMLLFSGNLTTQRNLGVVLTILGIIVILLPTNFGIGICLSPMVCHTTAKFLYILGGLVVIDGLITALQK